MILLKKNELLSLLLCFAVQYAANSFASSKETAAIVGQITDRKTGESLPGANVIVENSLVGASTDSDGRFRISKAPVGLQTLRVSYVGYSAERVKLQVKKDSTHVIHIALSTSAIVFDQVIVTGSRQAEDLNAAANSVSVLSKSEVRQRNRFRIDEALQTIPGVELVGENVNIRGGAGYGLLGLAGSRVLMLIDDVPVLTSDLGRANWDILPVTELERVEVLKGAASVLYGSGGISGVINIITQQPTTTPTFAFRQSVGIYSDPSIPEWQWTGRTLNFSRSDVSYSNTFGRVGLRLAVSRHTSTSDRENGDFNRWYVMAKPVIQFNDGSNLTMFATYSHDARGFFFQWRDQNHALTTNFPDRIEVDGFALSARYNKVFSPGFAMKARLSYNSQLIGLPFNLTKNFDPALGLSGELQGNWLPHENHTLTFGVDYRRDIVNAVYYGKHQGNAIAPFVQETWEVSDKWQLNAGVRYDSYFLVGDSAETQISPKFGTSYNPFAGTFFHASFGRGFRAPSIAERFSAASGNVNLLSNAELAPERSTLFDIGVRQRIGSNLSFEVAAFSNEYFDLIELAQISDQRLEFQFRNCPHARIQGLETEMKLRLWNDRIGLHANATWLDSKSLEADPFCNLAEGDPLPYRPKFSAFISPSLTLGAFNIEADYRYVSRFERVSLFPLDERVPQKILDLRAGFKWKQYTFLFQTKNAANYNYTIVEQNLGEIRNFSITLSGEF